MKKDSKLSELYVRSIEIQTFKQHYPTIALMMASRLSEFQKRNALFLGKLDKGISKLYDADVSKDANGKFEHENKEPKFISDEHKETFQREWKELMESPCQVTI